MSNVRYNKMDIEKAHRLLSIQKKRFNLDPDRVTKTDLQLAVSGTDQTSSSCLGIAGILCLGISTNTNSIWKYLSITFFIGMLIWQIILNRKYIQIRDYLIDNHIQNLEEKSANQRVDLTVKTPVD